VARQRCNGCAVLHGVATLRVQRGLSAPVFGLAHPRDNLKALENIMAKKSESTTTERFDALAAHEYEVNGEKRTEWLRIGRAFPNAHDGFTVRLRAVPAANNGEIVVIVKKREAKDEA
jgi:hypothetical protein